MFDEWTEVLSSKQINIMLAVILALSLSVFILLFYTWGLPRPYPTHIRSLRLSQPLLENNTYVVEVLGVEVADEKYANFDNFIIVLVLENESKLSYPLEKIVNNYDYMVVFRDNGDSIISKGDAFIIQCNFKKLLVCYGDDKNVVGFISIQ